MPIDHLDPFVSASEAQTPPVVLAQHPGECSDCGWEIDPGDPIRADGSGDWLHADCYAAIGKQVRRHHRTIEREARNAD